MPDDWAGHPLELELWLGGEGLVRLSTGLQAGLNPMHHRFAVAEQATDGNTIVIEAEVIPKGIFGTNIPEPRLDRAKFVVPQREVRAFERDLTMLLEVCEHLAGHDVVPLLLEAAEAALSELAGSWPTDTASTVSRYVLGYDNGLGAGAGAVPADWVSEAIDAARPTARTWSLPPAPASLVPLPAEAAEAVTRARSVLAERLERIKQDYPPVGRLCLTGHAHIDLAWLWPYAETRRKIRRTFSSVLDLMDRYPDFTFSQSSAQAYAWIEEDDPGVFARIMERVAEGRWEPSGRMWLEADCNLTGGESLVRHLVYGQRYFEQTFGKRHRVAWLPDVFGFSGGMPQILRGAGIDGFFTIKMYWNESNLFPYDLFELNSPLVSVPVGAAANDGAAFIDNQEWEPELGLGALETAFDGDGLILRLYEPYGRRRPVRIRLGQPIQSVERVDLMEEPTEAAPIELTDDGPAVRFEVRPFEIVTLRIRPECS